MATHTSPQDGYSNNLHQTHRQSSSSVSYIPPQSDNLAVTSNEAAKNGPFVLAIRDCLTFLRMLDIFPGIFMPFWTTNPRHEFYVGDSNLFGLIALAVASVVPVLLLLVALPAFIFLPGSACALTIAAGTAFIWAVCTPFQGPSLVTSEPPTDEAVIARQHLLDSERWIFLNGCCVTGHALQQNLNQLSETFGRPVQGVHNETWGILGDLVECIIQRAFGFYSKETRMAYEYVKAYCSNPRVKKVVLIGHSQGGIMVSQILDELFMDLPSELIAKLEVYTFGNAASHFNNPLRKAVNSTGEYAATLSPSEPTSLAASISEIPATDSPTAMVSPMTPLLSFQRAAVYSAAAHRSVNATTTTPPSAGCSPLTHSRNLTISPYLPHRVIPHIEHYCNSQDMVTRWGVLYSVKNVLGNRFCGHVFIREGASGHMLNQHYLAKMFPIEDLPASAAAAAAAARRSADPGVASFLDSIVEVDSATVAKRDGDAQAQLKVSRHNSLPLDASYYYHRQFKTSSISEKHDRWWISSGFEGLRTGEGADLKELDLAGAEGSRITVARAGSAEAGTEAEAQEGGGVVGQSRGIPRRVRDLSRLWRYMGGECPLD